MLYSCITKWSFNENEKWECSNREQTNNDPLLLSMTKTNFYVWNETILRVHNNANRDSYNTSILSEWIEHIELLNLLNFLILIPMVTSVHTVASALLNVWNEFSLGFFSTSFPVWCCKWIFYRTLTSNQKFVHSMTKKGYQTRASEYCWL